MEELDDYQVVFPTRVNENGKSVATGIKLDRKRRNAAAGSETGQDDGGSLRYKIEAYGRKFFLNLTSHRDFIAAGVITPRISSVEHWFEDDYQGGLGGTHCFYWGTVEGDPKSMVSLSLCQGLVSM